MVVWSTTSGSLSIASNERRMILVPLTCSTAYGRFHAQNEANSRVFVSTSEGCFKQFAKLVLNYPLIVTKLLYGAGDDKPLHRPVVRLRYPGAACVDIRVRSHMERVGMRKDVAYHTYRS